MMIALDELDAHVGLKRLEFCRARSADDRTGARLLMNPLLRQRLARSRSSIVILLLMFGAGAIAWGVVYLWKLAVLR